MNEKSLSLSERIKNATDDFEDISDLIYSLSENVKKTFQMLENIDSKYDSINQSEDRMIVFKSDLLTDIRITEDYVRLMRDDIDEMNKWAFGA